MNIKVRIAFEPGPLLNHSEFNDFQGNLKNLSDENYQKLKKEIMSSGFAFAPHVWLNPVDKKYYLIDGHQRIKCVTRLSNEGVEVPQIPTVLVHAKSFKEAKRRVLQGTSQYGQMTGDGLNEFMLSSEIDLKEIESFRFPEILEDKFLEQFTEKKSPQSDEDAVPEKPKNPVNKLGDLWTLGEHRLICGDSLEKSLVERLVNNCKVDLLWTDPPYGVSYTEKNEFLNNLGKGLRITKAIENDNCSIDEMKKIWVGTLTNAHSVLSDRSSYYIASPQGGDLMMMMMSIIASGFQLKHMVIWVKNNHVLGRCDYNYKHEPLLYGWKEKGTHEFHGHGKCKTSVWDFNKPLKNDLHPTMKPVELIEESILNSTLQGQSVIDLFGGSGSTLIACEKTGRKCFMSEIDPLYCDVILQRWADYTGKDPVREDGKSFSELKSETVIP